jgi:hypothetical protein
MGRQLINIEEFGDNEVRIELAGQGHYVSKKTLGKWIKEHSKELATEMSRNMDYPVVKPNKNLAVTVIACS